MDNNPEEHSFQYSMMAGLRIHRNRLPQVVNMKLYKMHKRKTDQDKHNISGKRSRTRTCEERFWCRSIIHRLPIQSAISRKKGDLKLVWHAVVYKVNDDCYLTALNNYRGSHSSFTNRCTFIKTLITIYIKIRWLLHISVYDHHQGTCNWDWLKLYWY